jgi:hypothetical protein
MPVDKKSSHFMFGVVDSSKSSQNFAPAECWLHHELAAPSALEPPSLPESPPPPAPPSDDEAETNELPHATRKTPSAAKEARTELW